MSPALGEPSQPGLVPADAHFHEAVTTTITWGCTERDRDAAASPVFLASHDAGTVTLAFAPAQRLEPLDLVRLTAATRYYPAREDWADGWKARSEGVDAPMTVSASGGTDVPAFSVVARSAETTSFRGVPDDEAVLPSGDLVLTWPDTRNDEVEAILYSGARIVWCKMPASAMTLRIPASMVESVRTHAGDYENFRGLVVTAARRTLVDVEGVAVEVLSEERRDRSLRARN